VPVDSSPDPIDEGPDMIDKDFLQMLACPETRQALDEASRDLLAKVNARIASGELKTKGGTVVKDPLESALVRRDGKILYPIRDRIFVLLADEGIPL